MLPFLLDDVARLHYQDMLQEFEASQRVAQVVTVSNRVSLSRRMRMATGQFFIAVGGFLAQTGTSKVTLDRAS